MNLLYRRFAIATMVSAVLFGMIGCSTPANDPSPTDEPDLTLLPATPPPTPVGTRIYSITPASQQLEEIKLSLNNELIKLPTGESIRLCGLIVGTQGTSLLFIERNGQVLSLKSGDVVSGYHVGNIHPESISLTPVGLKKPHREAPEVQEPPEIFASTLEMPLKHLLPALAQISRINLLIADPDAPELTKKSTLRMRGKSFQNILRQITAAHQLTLWESADLWVVGRPNKEHVSGRAAEEKLLNTLDQKIPQILLECQVVETTENSLKEMGVTFGSPPGKVGLKIAPQTKILPAEIAANLSALVGHGKAEVLARPSVLVLSGEEANIQIGNRVPFAVPVNSSGNSTQWRVEYLDAGIALKITPYVGSDQNITISLHPEISSISEWRMTQAGEFPVMSTRRADSLVRVKDQETIMIGGLLSETERENLTKVPLLGDIPFLGLPFQNRTKEKVKTEVVFLITPRIQ